MFDNQGVGASQSTEAEAVDIFSGMCYKFPSVSYTNAILVNLEHTDVEINIIDLGGPLLGNITLHSNVIRHCRSPCI